MDLNKNTIVIFTSDHGDLLGDHGLYLKGPTAYEGLLRVGFIAQGPGVQKNYIVDEPISSLDIAASFYELAGVPKPDDIQSKSLINLMAGKRETRDVSYSEWNQQPSRTGVELNLRTVRTKTAKLTLETISSTRNWTLWTYQCSKFRYRKFLMKILHFGMTQGFFAKIENSPYYNYCRTCQFC